MQFLWKYVDDILGKGFTPFDIIEMVLYFMVTQIPMALPISILLSSVMVFGNLSERYELSSMKSAGVSLVRIMRPAIILAIGTAIFSLLASNIFKPQANFQFQKRIRSMRVQKPALVIEEKIFNKDFKNYVIRVNKKEKDSNRIEDILIYDHSRTDKSLINVTKATSGQMYSDENKDFVIELENGTQYTEMKRNYTKEGKKEYPFMRTEFKKFKKIFSTSEFDTGDFMASVNKGDMLNAPQLLSAIDSVDVLQKDIMKVYTSKLIDTIRTKDKAEQKITNYTFINPDTLTSIIDLLGNKEQRRVAIEQAKRNSENKRDQFRMKESRYSNQDYSYRKYQLRLHQQLSFAFICIVFVFIGAPLGSIIRKGGFGYPLLYAILFYMLFIMLAIMGEKLTRSGDMNPFLSAWISNLILIPIAIYLTYKALKDSKSTIFTVVKDFIKSKMPAKE